MHHIGAHYGPEDKNWTGVMHLRMKEWEVSLVT